MWKCSGSFPIGQLNKTLSSLYSSPQIDLVLSNSLTNTMDEASIFPSEDCNFPIPFDLFVSKQRKRAGTQGFIKFVDSSDKLVYKVPKLYPKSTDFPHSIKLIKDSSDNTLISLHRVSKGSWKVYRGNDKEGKDLIFTAERSLDEFSKTEFTVLIFGENSEEPKTELRMKGCPFRRSCTIYKGNSIVAESSLNYKLEIGNMFATRHVFRVTIFPGLAEQNLIVSLIVIFFDGRKLWR